MAQEKIEILFKPKGDQQLINAIKQLDIVTKRLNGSTSIYEKELKKLELQQKKTNKQAVLGVRNLRNMDKASTNLLPRLSVLRSKLLIVSFGIALVSAAFKKLFDNLVIQEQAEKKLEVALGKTNTALLNQASALQQMTVFGDEAIIEVQALIGSFIKEEDAIKKATKATLDLAAAKGMDLKSAGDLVAKTLGSSTNSLSRYGVEVVGAVGSTQRLESLTTNIANLFGGQAAAAADTLGGRVTQMTNAFGDANEALGKAFAPTIMKLSKFFKETAESATEFLLSFSETPLERSIRRLEELGEDASGLRLTLLSMQKDAVFNELGIELDNVAAVEKDILDTTKSIKTHSDIVRIAIAGQGTEYEKLLENGYKIEDLQKKIAQEINIITDRGNTIVKNDASHAKSLLEQFNIQKKNEEFGENQLSIDTERLQKLLKIQEIIAEINNLMGFGQDDDSKDLFGMTPDQWSEMESRVSMWSNSVMNIANQYQVLQQTQLNASKQRELDNANSIKSERRRQKEIDKINEKYAAKQKALNQESKRIKRAQTVIATSTGIMEAYASKELDPLSRHVMAAFIAIQGALQLKTIDAQKYATGGLVGGRRHSQGGTMIEAERGEYVISRKGVDAIGIEALNRINAGQGGGSVNVTFAGNVLSKDFIEDEAIPQIKEAIRRGADIGVG
jgi:hypothetical protein